MKKHLPVLATLGLFAVVLLAGSSTPPEGPAQKTPGMPAPAPPSYSGPRNQFLNGTIFEDVSAAAGFDHQGHGKCVAMGDYDKDGDLDIYVSVVYGRNKLFQNEGQFKFKDMAPSLAVDNPFDTHGIAMADFDNNGYLDIFCANNVEALSLTRGLVLQPNAFYLGFDEGFAESAAKSGLAGIDYNFSCGVTTADVNNDGLLDIFVAKGAYRKGPDCANSLYVNNGDGTYRDIAKEAGVADQGNGYCCAFGDYDNDGDPDLYVGSINDTDQPVTRILYRNNGDGTFSDVTEGAWTGEPRQQYLLLLGRLRQRRRPRPFPGQQLGSGTSGARVAGRLAPPEQRRRHVHGRFERFGFGAADEQPGLDRGRYRQRRRPRHPGQQQLGRHQRPPQRRARPVHRRSTKRPAAPCFMATARPWATWTMTATSTWPWATGGGRARRTPACGSSSGTLTGGRGYLKVDLEGTKSNRSAVMSRVWVYDAGQAGDPKSLRGFRQVTAGNGTFPGNPLQAHFGVDAAKKYDVRRPFPVGPRGRPARCRGGPDRADRRTGEITKEANP